VLPPQLDSLRAYVASRPAPRDVARGQESGGGAGIVVVGSGRGGAGTSVVAALLALSAAAMGRRVLLVDLDEHVGPQRYLLGAAASHSLVALRQGLAPEALLVPVSATLSLLPGGPTSPDAPDAPLAPAERRALLRRASTCFAAHDLTVIDAGSRLDTVRAGLETARAAADAAAAAPGGNLAVRLLVVTGSDPIALAASYALVKGVGAHEGTPGTPPLAVDVLANRVSDDDARLAFEHVDAAARQFLQHPLRHAGVVPDDASLGAALRAGMPLQDAAVGSPAAVAMQLVASRLAELTSAASAARGGRSAVVPRSAATGYGPPALGTRAAATLAYSGSPTGSAR
jgi:MinD-like ATPase involved in chromosome partitioning or flagellar assembly